MRLVCSLLIIILPILSFAAIKEASNIKASNIVADFVEYNTSTQLIYAKNNIYIVMDDYLLTSDNLLYDIEKDILWLEGNVKIKDKHNRIIIGEKVILKDKLKVGIISDLILSFGNNILLVAKLAQRIDENKARLYDSQFTPCQVTCNKNPIWQINARDTYIDFDQNKITYKNVFFEVYGMPIFFLPYFTQPTPSAPATSGILVPNIKNEGVSVPLYLRAKPNMDFTLTPRIFTKYQIFELEGRYKPNSTDYIIFEGNYGNLPYFLEKDGTKIKNEKVNSYYFQTNGYFFNQNYLYGFNLARTSDKAYLKNYYNNYSSYLTSQIFLNKTFRANYFSIKGLNFQGLGTNDSKLTDPLIFPKINTKNVISLNDNDTSLLVIKNDSLLYREKIGKQLTRFSLQGSLLHKFYTSSGQVLDFTLENRGDFYLVKHAYLDKSQDKKYSVMRNIPELQTIWRYPLSGNLKQGTALFIEPIVSLALKRKLKPHDTKFIIIDPDKYELSEKNIFFSNRYGGIDYHDFGNSLSYGINNNLFLNKHYLEVFLGQAKNVQYNINQKNHNTENVGKIGLKLFDQVELFYNLRKDKNFKPIRDEVGSNIQNGKVNILASFIQLSDLKKYYSIEHIMLSNNRVRQFYGNFDYNLTKNWTVGISGRVDVSTKRPQLLARTIKVTYFKDCVRIAAKISSDYLVDNTRGIKKTISSPTISIGLKTLNM